MRVRPPSNLTQAEIFAGLDDDTPVVVYGLVVRYQHPSTNAVFMTFENETGRTPVSLWTPY